MPFEVSKYPRFLEEVARSIDIPPGKYQDAVNRYHAVGDWLEAGSYPGCSGELRIYPQGSFRLGTVVRPIRNGIEASYDIDLVSEFPMSKPHTEPGTVKSLAGHRLQEHETYRRMLDEEGRRCWTLEYAEQDGVGFHLDVLPGVPDPRNGAPTAIAITNKDGRTYTWSASDPQGYGAWFDAKNRAAFLRESYAQKRVIQESSPRVFASIDAVPDQLVRTPLQRAIQLEKRHRDLMFNKPSNYMYAPISVIITTLSAHLYQNEADAHSALSGIVTRLGAHAGLLEGRAIDPGYTAMGLIRRTADGGWYIGNPVNPAENFADRWHEDNHARARAFFQWVGALRDDLVNLPSYGGVNLQERLSRSLGAAPVAANIGLIVPTEVAAPPRIHISRPAKPWKA